MVRCLFGSLIGALILRACCATFNRNVKEEDGKELKRSDAAPIVSREQGLPQAKIAEKHSPTENPYSSPMTPLDSAYPEAPDPGIGVPEPDFGKAFLICITSTVIQVVAEVAIVIAFVVLFSRVSASVQLRLFVASTILAMVFGFFIFWWIAKLRLPTSPGKAIRVAGVFYGSWILLGAVAGTLVGVLILLKLVIA